MSINFPKAEEEVLAFWREVKAFERQLELTEGKKNYNFYDGPPFATGLPHYGHLLASTIKDIIPRYWAMKGYYVTRRFGWDTHGLPIEHQIDKQFGISGRDAVLQMGIERYNAECRAIVMTFAKEWRQTIERLGRWIDFDNDYKTMDVSFMESVWNVLSKINDQGLLYRGYRIMPYSTALCTPLSQMEAGSNEKVTNDPAVIVSFPLKPETGKDASLIIWTTTPWTLPSNLFIAANPDFEYLEILDNETGKKYITLESGIPMLYPKKAAEKHKILGKIKGKDLIGWKYEPLFPYFVDSFSDCFQVIPGSHVEESQTGLVHTAPAFGQEDYDAAVAAGFIGPKRLPPCPVDEKGCFTSEVPEYAEQHVKVADKQIIKDLKPTGRLLSATQISHVDKFCWRSDTQLIRKAVSSWFIKVGDAIPIMLKNLDRINWVPDFVKTRRFYNFVEAAHDWNISRNRYWGTPIPLWVSDDYEEVVCVGSIEELKRLSGYTGELNDIHRDKVDHITIPSKKGKGVLRRVEEVFDCWFDSGAMPYASKHYPFENGENFRQESFPADFIAEGLDQTRGWFYSLTVIGALLPEMRDTPVFLNNITNGLILAEDGKKMSKSLKNYPDPTLIIDRYGSDALRLYLVSSPVVRAEPLRFKEVGVKEVVAKVLLPLFNSYKFLNDQAILWKKTTSKDFIFHTPKTNNVFDRWILAGTQSMIRFINQEMSAYRLYTVTPRLLLTLDNLTNWYIRFNRKRLKGTADLGLEDVENALSTLTQVLFTLLRALAPFIPFITEHIYGRIKQYIALDGFEDSRSIHFLPFPEVDESFFDETIERKVSAMQQVIQLTRTARERRTISLKTPLISLVVIADQQFLDDVAELESYIKEELNVRDLILTSDEEKYNIHLEARVDWPTLGKKLKGDVKKVKTALPNLSQEELRQFLVDKKITVAGGIELTDEDINVVRVLAKQSPGAVDPLDGKSAQYEAAFSDQVIILLDVTIHPHLAEERLVRECIGKIQNMRKKAGLVPTDEVHMEYSYRPVEDASEVADVPKVFTTQEQLFQKALRGTLKHVPADANANGHVADSVLLEEEHELGDLLFKLRLSRK